MEMFCVVGSVATFSTLPPSLPPSLPPALVLTGTLLLLMEMFWVVGSVAVVGIAWLSLETHGWRYLTRTYCLCFCPPLFLPPSFSPSFP